MAASPSAMALAALCAIFLLQAPRAALAEDVLPKPPLLRGEELPMPLDFLVADTPLGPLPFPGCGPQGPPPPPPRGDRMRALFSAKGSPFAALSWPPPHPPRPPHPGPPGPPRPPPGPPPPGVMELAVKLLAAAGQGIEDFYSKKPDDPKAVATSDFSTCGYCAGNETKKLLTAVEDSVSKLCADAPSVALAEAAAEGLEPADPTMAPFTHFCELYPKLSVITVLALMSRLKVQPLSLALSRCAAHGPCALSPKPEASPGGSLLGFMEQVDRHLESEDVGAAGKGIETGSKGVETGSKGAETGPEDVVPGEDFLDMGVAEDSESDCQTCLVEGFKLVKEVVSAKFKFVCANAKCPRILAMCNFTKEYPYLSMVAIVSKLKPWERVVPGCFMLGACKPPPPPGPPPPGPPPAVENVHPLPVFPALDLDIFAPPPPPPPPFGMRLMHALRHFVVWATRREDPPPPKKFVSAV